MKPIIIGVDTGNRCIKTVHNVFVSGINKQKAKPIQSKEVLKYNDEYYTLTKKRVNYLQDKTENDEYFALTLFGIAKELKFRGIKPSNEAIPILLGVGLPPSHLGLYKDKFKKYFERAFIKFNYEGESYKIQIQNVIVFSQGYAAIFDDFQQISTFDKSYIVDIGGYTTDVIQLNNGKIDTNVCQSINAGMIILYNKIKDELENKYGIAPDENQIDHIMATGIEINPKYPMVDIINQITTRYVEDLVSLLKEKGIILTFAKGIFIGGGSIRLKKWINQNQEIYKPYYIDSIHANAKGYEACLNAIQNQKKSG